MSRSPGALGIREVANMSEHSRTLSVQVAGPGALSVSRLVFASALDARRFLEQAQAQADALLAELESHRTRVLTEARRIGSEEGFAQVAELLLRARAEAHELKKRSEQRLVALAVRIAERILGAQLELAPEYVLSVARKAMEQVPWCRKLVYRVHPEDLALLEQHREALFARAAEVDAQFVADAKVRRGGCILETEVGRIDATLESQLRAIERALTEQGPVEEETR